LKIGQHFFLEHLNNKIIFNYVKFVATKKGMTTNFFSPLLFWDPGSGMGKTQDP
jgi:glutamine synthetase